MSDRPSLDIPFPPKSEADWRVIAERATRGAGLASLQSYTHGGIPIPQILSQREPGQLLATRAGGTAWDVIQRVDHPDPAKARALAKADLEAGADGLDLVFADSPVAFGGGLSGEAGLDLLSRLRLDDASLRIDGGEDSIAILSDFRRADMEKARGVTLAFDPLASLAASGGLRLSLEDRFAELALAAIPLKTVVVADGRVWHEAGASETQELGILLATLIAELRGLHAAGLPVFEAVPRLGAVLSVDVDQLVSIAKLRAFRLATARLLAALGVNQRRIPLHAVSSRRMLSRKDPHTNMLRLGIAAFAAGVGGADSVSLLPFTATHGLPTPFAARVARNMQLMLCDESQLHRVADPSAGAGAFEALAEEIANGAWQFMQAIEEKGGMLDALRTGFLQARVRESADAEVDRIASGKTKLVGTTAFLPTAPIAVEFDPFPARPKATEGGWSISVEPITLATLEDAVTARTPEAQAS